MIALQDIGATFGGAGRTSKSTAKMNLKAWTGRPFQACEAFLLGRRAGMPWQSHGLDDGRRERPGRPSYWRGRACVPAGSPALLTDAHVRALMATARVEKLSEPHAWRDPSTGTSYKGSEAWVAAFKDKVRQITQRRCAP